jgi:penicillin-binding protein 2
MAVTPLQMAVTMAAIANGGKVLWPRLVERIESADPTAPEPAVVFEKGRVRDELGVKPEHLKIVHEAMLADTEEAGATGVRARVQGLEICGKTGTAQIMDAHNKTIADTAWFASFAPAGSPRYAVVVMIETDVNAGTGGRTCAPIAGNIYRALREMERGGTNGPLALAKTD